MGVWGFLFWSEQQESSSSRQIAAYAVAGGYKDPGRAEGHRRWQGKLWFPCTMIMVQSQNSTERGGGTFIFGDLQSSAGQGSDELAASSAQSRRSDQLTSGSCPTSAILWLHETPTDENPTRHAPQYSSLPTASSLSSGSQTVTMDVLPWYKLKARNLHSHHLQQVALQLTTDQRYSLWHSN